MSADLKMDSVMIQALQAEPIVVDVKNYGTGLRHWVVSVGVGGLPYHHARRFTKRGAMRDAVRSHNRLRALLDSMG